MNKNVTGTSYTDSHLSTSGPQHHAQAADKGNHAMPEAALALLFLPSALFAVGVMVQSWWQHGAQALAAHGRFEVSSETRAFAYRIVSHDVIWLPRATVIAFPVRDRLIPAPQPLRAAA
jgi:hypothetical protein